MVKDKMFEYRISINDLGMMKGKKKDERCFEYRILMKEKSTKRTVEF
jgi:hypothetical protein